MFRGRITMRQVRIALVLGLVVAAMNCAWAGECKKGEHKGDKKEAAVKGTISVAKVAETSYPDLAKIGLDAAVKTALAAEPGKVLKVELEEVNEFLVWEVEMVKDAKTIVTISVDAGDGKVLLKETEDPKDADEDKGDHKGDGKDGDDEENEE
jgi:uncharacterized membrane protein YkoI